MAVSRNTQQSVLEGNEQMKEAFELQKDRLPGSRVATGTTASKRDKTQRTLLKAAKSSQR